jgi:hypothetical protein
VGEKKSYQLNCLAAATGLRPIAGPTMQHTEFGNALLTRPEVATLQPS